MIFSGSGAPVAGGTPQNKVTPQNNRTPPTPPTRDAAKSIGKERDRSDNLLLRSLIKVLVDTGIGFT